MLNFKLIVFALIISGGVLGRDAQRGNTRHRQVQDEYKYNHPPGPEPYEAIPVAVVYEDQNIREDKSIKNDVTQANNVEEVNNETPNSATTLTKEQSGNEVVSDKNLTQPEQQLPKATTYRPPYLQKEQQIPVAVVYEPETINYQKHIQNKNRGTNNRRKPQLPAPEEKDTSVDKNESPLVQTNGHIGTESIPLARRKTTRPAPVQKTDVENNTPSSVQNAQNEYSISTTTSDQPKEIQRRRRPQKPAAIETETTIEYNTLSSVQNLQNEFSPPIPTPVQPKEIYIRRRPQKVATIEAERTVEYSTPSSVQNGQIEYSPKIPKSDQPKEIYTRRKPQKPDTKEAETTVGYNTPSSVQIVQNEYSPPIPTSDQPKEIYTRRRPEKPDTQEAETTVGYNTPLIVENVQNSTPIPTPDQPKEIFTRRRPQKPATKGAEATVEEKVKSSVPENQKSLSDNSAEKKENSNDKRIIKPAAPQERPSFDDDRTSERQNENKLSVPQAEISETFQNTKYSEQFPKRGDLTRVREVVPIVQSENVVYSQSGNFKYSYEGGDGTKAFEEGELKTFDDESAGEAVSGGFSYVAKDGNEYSLSYTADENGYRPVGAHLPTPPPIPPAIARALAYLATKTTPEPVTESLAEYDQQ